MAFSLLGLGGTYRYLGAYDEAAHALEESVAIYRDLGDDWSLVMALDNQAMLSRTLGRFDEARNLLQESVTLIKPLGDPYRLAEALVELGQLMEAQGNYPDARRLYLECLEAVQQFPSSFDFGYALFYLGRLSHVLSEDEEAIRYFQRALQTAKDGGILRLQLDIVLGMAELLREWGDRERSVELLVLNVHHPASRFETRDRAQQLLQELAFELPPEVFQSAQEKGRIAPHSTRLLNRFTGHPYSLIYKFQMMVSTLISRIPVPSATRNVIL